MKQSKPTKSRARPPSGRARKPGADTANKATTDEFEREDMGIAPKE